MPVKWVGEPMTLSRLISWTDMLGNPKELSHGSSEQLCKVAPHFRDVGNEPQRGEEATRNIHVWGKYYQWKIILSLKRTLGQLGERYFGLMRGAEGIRNYWEGCLVCGIQSFVLFMLDFYCLCRCPCVFLSLGFSYLLLEQLLSPDTYT